MKIQFNKDKKTIFLSVISGLVCLLLVTSMLIQFKTVDKSKVLRKSLGLDEVTELETNAVLYEELYGSAAPSSGQSGNDATTGAADSSAYSSNPYGTDQNGQYYGQYGQ